MRIHGWLAAMALTMPIAACAPASPATPGTTPAAAPTQAGERQLTGDEHKKLQQAIEDLRTGAAPVTRNAAAYEISSFGPAAKEAVPALIAALKDPEPTVRFPATVALREIGPAAAAAVPALEELMKNDRNDEIAAGARRALDTIQGRRDNPAAETP